MDTKLATDRTQASKAKLRGLWRKWPTKVIISIAVAILVFGALIRFNVIKLRSSEGNKIEQRTAAVQRGSLSTTITSSGPVVSANRAEISSYVNATVTKVHFKEGDEVKEGDLLIELDDLDAVLNVEKILLNIEQNQLTLQSNIDSLNNLSMPSPFSGEITNIQVKEGDMLSKNAPVFTLTDKSSLKLMVPFGGRDIDYIKTGQSVTVNIPALMQSIQGVVSYISNSSYSTASGGELRNVEVLIDNPGSLEEGMVANAEIDTSSGVVSSNDSGTLSYINSLVVKSETGGLVKMVNVKENQFVDRGHSLLELEDDSVVIAKDSTDLKIKDLQLQLDSARKQLEYYKVYAPADGVIMSQEIKEGDVVKNGQIVCTISNNNQMELTVSIDELDIEKIKVGMKTLLTVDALSKTTDKPLEGSVSKIALEGNSSGGVTTYPVTISVEGTEGLRGGMNADAEIYISDKKDTLYVPIEAIQKMEDRTFVMVKSDNASLSGEEVGVRSGMGAGRRQANADSENANVPRAGSNSGNGSGAESRTGGSFRSNARLGQQLSDYYAGSVPKQVETGIVTKSYIEILSGLNEGDEVVLPALTTSQSQSLGNQFGGFPMGGGGMSTRTTRDSGGMRR